MTMTFTICRSRVYKDAIVSVDFPDGTVRAHRCGARMWAGSRCTFWTPTSRATVRPAGTSPISYTAAITRCA